MLAGETPCYDVDNVGFLLESTSVTIAPSQIFLRELTQKNAIEAVLRPLAHLANYLGCGLDLV